VETSSRVIEFTDNPDNDEAFKSVGTNSIFTGLTGTHTFRFSARKRLSTSADMTVGNSSLNVICVLNTL
jgi:hypothetical protein